MSSLKLAAVLAFVAGALLIVSGSTGSTGVAGKALKFLIDNLGGPTGDLLLMVLQALNFIADLGGLSVIIGGALIYVKRKRAGKFIIGIGAGMGLISFITILISVFLRGWAHVITFLLLIPHSLGWMGVILSIVAILLAR